MTKHSNLLALLVSIAINLLTIRPATADVTITSFDDFTSDTLYASWLTATIQSSPTNYVMTATGYGSNYKFIGSPRINGTGATILQLDVTLSGPPSVDGKLGPIIDLIDADGTRYSYRWYGQALGHRLLKMSVKSPTQIMVAGSTPGLDLSNLLHMHMQLDPGGFGASGAYTIAWNDLSLTGFPAFKITSQSFNPVTGEFTLTWVSLPSKTYTILAAPDMISSFAPLLTGIDSTSGTTTAIVIMPSGTAGFLQVQQE